MQVDCQEILSTSYFATYQGVNQAQRMYSTYLNLAYTLRTSAV